ncbi:type I polyketide synthase [Nocardia yamanashiensis]|uniref:type I polyketide synthase n=1 Tax=Nocardia yamanashiensis TaxID=209247 RepID=UPI002277207E|nr:type I polyketide synthase [Nocardia yamanashiensis]
MSALEEARSEPVAIVGMACRFPGGIDTPGKLWETVLSGRETVGRYPEDRGWDLDTLFDDDPAHRGTTYARHGSFIDNAADFDAAFFGMSPREARVTDPQHRLLLETSWEALESATIDPVSLVGSDTAVYLGAIVDEYGDRLRDPRGSMGEYEGQVMLGNSRGVLSGRVSYTLGLEGPAVTLDTACSSSLVALHLGVQALRAGQTAMALVGGATVMSTPAFVLEFSRMQGLAPDGRSKAFGAGADGMGLGEGVGVLVLERLSDAQRLGHPVLALVRGSAINQDGASNGLTAPSRQAQQKLIRSALADAQLTAADIDVIEAHGTGTPLGDPIEAAALINTYGAAHTPDHPLLLGSVKSNIGHSQAAAGMAGVIKMVHAMRSGLLPRTLHADPVSDLIDWDAGNIRVLRENRAWPAAGAPRRAAVSSFGVSGTNAHVVLEGAPDPVAAAVDGSADPAQLPWLLSAKTPAALAGQARRLREFLDDQPGARPVDIARSLVTTRTAFPHRAAFVASDLATAAACLEAIEHGHPHPAVTGGRAGEREVVFVFPGQGSQWREMGRELLDSAPVFAARIAECAAALAPWVEWDLEQVLRGVDGAPGLDRVDVVQPALFSVMVSLAALWRSLGVEPGAVIGHSQGEIAALCVAGGLSLEAAARIVAVRSRALTRLSGSCTMAALAVDAERARNLLAEYGDDVAIAAHNGPRAVVISGPVPALERIVARCQADGFDARVIDVDYGSHSAQVEQIRPDLDELRQVEAGEFDLRFFSALHGRRTEPGEVSGAYWYENLRHPVEFDAAVRAAMAAGFDTFVEVSPHPVLLPAIESIGEDEGATVTTVGTLRRDDGGMTRLLTSAGQLHCAGVEVDWQPCFGQPGGAVVLPTYAFDRKRFWVDPPRALGATPGIENVEHPVLTGRARVAATGECLYFGSVSLRTQSWLADHAVQGRILFPGTAFLELAAFVADQLGLAAVDELTVVTPLFLAENRQVQLQLAVGALDGMRRRVVVHSFADEEDGEPARWIEHASGFLTAEPAVAAAGADAAWPPVTAEPVDIDGLYTDLAELGYHYGPAFQGVRRLWTTPDGFAADIECPPGIEDTVRSFYFHPALLDAGLHGFAAGQGEVPRLVLPFSWQGVRFSGMRSGRMRVSVAFTGNQQARIIVRDGHGLHLGSVESLTVRELTTTLDGAERPAESLFAPTWVRLTQPPGHPAGEPPVTVALFGGRANALELGGGPRGRTENHSGAIDLVAEYAHPGVVLDGPVSDGVRTARVLALVFEPGTGLAPDGAALAAALAVLNDRLAAEAAADSRILVLTRSAVRATPADAVHPHTAALVAMVRSIQLENPDRITIVDVDDLGALERAVALAVHTDLNEAAIRRGAVYLRRLSRAAVAHPGHLALPESGGWRITPGGDGVVEKLAIEESGLRADTELAPDEVLIAVRAVGLNFRDVLIALNVYEGPGRKIGNECAGEVVAVGAAVTEFQAGDRVFGRVADSLADLAVAHRSELAVIPGDWSFATAASIPITYGSAYHAVVNIAGLRAGEKVLVHSAASGVGMAAVGLARLLGAEVYATASPQKFGVLTALGIPDDHLCSSRDGDFERHFRELLGGNGFDVAIDAFSGPLVDATLRLMRPGGRFVEIGRADIRDPESVAREYDGVRYDVFNLFGLTPQQIRDRLGHIVDLVVSGEWPRIPVRSWDIRELPDAFKVIGDGLHVGKNVVTIPRAYRAMGAGPAAGTVLITGGVGMAGAHTARHLVRDRGERHLLLVSRNGENTTGARELADELRVLGADSVRIAACDIADETALTGLLASIPAAHPLTGVVHAAGVLRDGIAAALTPEDLHAVLAPKAVGAWHLHRLTERLDLDYFVLFSSVAGTLGNAGQANYAAANGYLDGLAALRHDRGLPATAIAWGLWSEASAMTAGVVTDESARLKRLGILGMSAAEALHLFDLAMGGSDTAPIACRFDRARLRSALFKQDGGIATSGADSNGRAAQRNDGFRIELAGTPPKQRAQVALAAVRREIAATLGLESSNDVEPDSAFRALGFDSLTAVELRNRINALTGLRLPTTVVFDNPTPRALATAIVEELAGELRDAVDDELRVLLSRMKEIAGSDRLTEDGRSRFGTELGDLMRELFGVETVSAGADLTALTDDELYEAIDREIELGRAGE